MIVVWIMLIGVFDFNDLFKILVIFVNLSMVWIGLLVIIFVLGVVGFINMFFEL